MDHYADDLAAVTAHLDLRDAVHVGHSTGGGEVAHYIARHGEGRVAKAVLISAVPPLMVQTDANPGGLPKSVFDGLQAQLAANRSEFYRALAVGTVLRLQPAGRGASEAIIENWWRQGMMGGAKAHYDGIVAFSQTDFTEDLKKITVPVLVMHGDDDQIVPYADSGAAVGGAAAERHAEDLHGIPARHADHAGRDDQRGPAGVHAVLTNSGADYSRSGRTNPGLLQRPRRCRRTIAREAATRPPRRVRCQPHRVRHRRARPSRAAHAAASPHRHGTRSLSRAGRHCCIERCPVILTARSPVSRRRDGPENPPERPIHRPGPCGKTPVPEDLPSRSPVAAQCNSAYWVGESPAAR